MAEYIERESLLNDGLRYEYGIIEDGLLFVPMRDVIKSIKNAPPFGVVPVVRCKDCEYFRRNLENDTYCGCVGGLSDPEEYDFCSYGKVKEAADDI